MVPVPLVDCFKGGINHVKVLFDGHLGFPPPSKRMEAGRYRWITDAAISSDCRNVDVTNAQIRWTQSL